MHHPDEANEAQGRHLDFGFVIKLAGWGLLGTLFFRMIVSPLFPLVDLWVATFFCEGEVRRSTEVFNPRPGETVWNFTTRCMYSAAAGVDITMLVFPVATFLTAIPVILLLAWIFRKRVFAVTSP